MKLSSFLAGLAIGIIFTSLFVEVKAKPHQQPIPQGDDIYAEIARGTRETVERVRSGQRSKADLLFVNKEISRRLYGSNN